MLPENLERLLALPDEARVLDVGGWAGPHNRADYIIDVMPYETRGILMPNGFGPGPERFSKETWVEGDLCGHEPWPFEDDFFDFVICTFTLEDLRDPIRTCQEMSRVSKAGYFEVPSVLDELTWWNPEGSGGPWVGHKHHHWICTWEDGELVFLHKSHSLHSNWRVRVPRRWADQLTLEERVLARFWEGELPARERLAIGTYPYDELEREIRERFQPSAAELKALELRERARGAGGRLLGPFRRAAAGAIEKLGR